MNVKKIFRYLKLTINYGHNYTRNDEIKLYVDADYVGDIETRKSTTGFIILIGNTPTSCVSKLQHCVSTSTAESEYYSLSVCFKHCIWYLNLFKELNYDIKYITIKIFPGYNFTELLPELPILENGHPNIDYKIYIISNEEIEKLESMFQDDDEFIFNIFNNNKSLNLVKVFYVLSRLDDSLINTESDFWYNLDEFKSSTMIDDNGNFTFLQRYNKTIKNTIEYINEQNFIEIFPGYNFTELLPELPIQENGHPNIDFRNYLISEDEYNNLETKYDNNFEYFLFDIFNNNEYLNLVKVLNTLSKLDNININTINIDNRNYSTFSEYLELFGDNNVSMNENNEYIFNNKYYNTENDTNNNDKTISNININQNERDEFKTKNGTLTVHINK